ncbi:predicted protein [Sclerotinia sclerotiorum 1980 UF-70]|uniref:Uncharacterized protein n=1 Tax=Sclerotinia sclerotiorum (strain ATCC 18683 / 1980 / Ss-1) TaxID=665079 RepID=A7EPG6_SCLS1|nr:predicted protein [Sclerotinia sclerotiorum 1980 UF-70]EDO04732.1 predicted protein [Sclerotinia sclerotiorum 1980 UF-70]
MDTKKVITILNEPATPHQKHLEKIMDSRLSSHERTKEELRDIFVREELRIHQSKATQVRNSNPIVNNCSSSSLYIYLEKSWTVKDLRAQAIKGLALIDIRNIWEVCDLKPHLENLLFTCRNFLVTRQEIPTLIYGTDRDNIYHGLIKITIHIGA